MELLVSVTINLKPKGRFTSVGIRVRRESFWKKKFDVLMEKAALYYWGGFESEEWFRKARSLFDQAKEHEKRGEWKQAAELYCQSGWTLGQNISNFYSDTPTRRKVRFDRRMAKRTNLIFKKAAENYWKVLFPGHKNGEYKESATLDETIRICKHKITTTPAENRSEVKKLTFEMLVITAKHYSCLGRIYNDHFFWHVCRIYSEMAKLEEDDHKRVDYYLLATEARINIRGNETAASIEATFKLYKKILGLAPEESKAKVRDHAFNLYSKILHDYWDEDAGEYYRGGYTDNVPGWTLTAIAKIVGENERKVEYFVKAGDFFCADRTPYHANSIIAHDCYALALELASPGSELYDEIRKNAIAQAILAGNEQAEGSSGYTTWHSHFWDKDFPEIRWKEHEKEIEIHYPSLFSILQKKNKVKVDYGYWFKPPIDLPGNRIADALGYYHAAKEAAQSEIGFVPSDKVIIEGLTKWKENGYRLPEVPLAYLLQTLAVSKDKDQMEVMIRLLGTEQLRDSRDFRRIVASYLEDNWQIEQNMASFFAVASNPSGEGVLKDILMLTAANSEKDGDFAKAAKAYEKTIDLIEDADLKAECRRFAIESYVLAEKNLHMEKNVRDSRQRAYHDSPYTHGEKPPVPGDYYTKAAELSEEIDEKVRLYLLAAEKNSNSSEMNEKFVFGIYKVALELVPPDSSMTKEIWDRIISFAIIKSDWKTMSKEIEHRCPELYSQLRIIEEKENSNEETEEGKKERYLAKLDRQFLQYCSTSMPPARITEALNIFHEAVKEIGINPARMSSSMGLIRTGVSAWRENDYAKPAGIPDFFLFQTIAAAEDDSQLNLMRKLLGTKSLRNSRDDRRTVMWFLEDNRHTKRHMEQFYHALGISSEKKVVKNIARLTNILPIIYLIEPSFSLKDTQNSEQLNGKIDRTLNTFIDRRTADPSVKKRFFDRIEEFSNNRFLEAVLNLYPRYAEYEGLSQLLDISLAAIVMGDFHKIKFPTKQGIDSTSYLNDGQKRILLRATGQLGFLGKKARRVWETNEIRIDSTAKDSVDTAKQAKKDVERRIADLKYHFELHMHEQKGDVEGNFSFNDDYISKIGARLAGLEENSADFRKLKHIESVLVSINELEKMDLTDAKKRQEDIKKYLRSAAYATKNLFTRYYGFDEESLQSLQAKMDIALLDKLLLGEKEKLNVRSLKAYESSDYLHLILAGTEPDNCGSCQRYDGTPHLMVGLSGYLLNSTVKIIRVENQDGIVVGRAMLRVVEADGKPALFLERAYYRNASSGPNVDEIIIETAKKKAEAMGMPIFTTWQSSKKTKKMTIVRREGLSRYEYSDGLGGAGSIDLRSKGKVSSEVSVL